MSNMLRKKSLKFWKNPNAHEETESISNSVSVVEQFDW